MEEEILEIGDDGAFEITSTKAVKQAAVVLPDFDVVHESQEEEFNDNRSEALESINPGDFKIYKAEGSVFILVKLHLGETVSKIGHIGQEVKIYTEAGKQYTVSLRNICPVDPKGGKCTTWKDYVSVKYPIAKS
eukprot:CAMPEP_0170358832 /NCGR_PEP_ID=MMETSP0117_2-20130122/2432_1 /TAXON_ID=400756 /ORGANISM="Durinskia baltica, Strain CSIRO CS-38" /LENGTH=133 /DNA_ID=CAMNT_0010613055 /DNA_START=15 /DNA_END=416 /DNA_ORIENTATION=+